MKNSQLQTGCLDLVIDVEVHLRVIVGLSINGFLMEPLIRFTKFSR